MQSCSVRGHDATRKGEGGTACFRRHLSAMSGAAHIQPSHKTLLALRYGAWRGGRQPVDVAILNAAPRGNVRPVIVFPALVPGDFSTFALRNYIARLGYATHASEQDCVPAWREAASDRRSVVTVSTGSLPTRSAGALMAFTLVNLQSCSPGAVRPVTILGTPFAQ